MSQRLSMMCGLFLLLAGCSAPRVAADLARVTSGHVSTLNGELKQYVAAANAGRAADAERIAAARVRWQQDNAYNQRFLSEWQIDRNTPFLNAFEALQKQSAAEMASTESYVKRQSDTAAQLAASYSTVSYSSTQLTQVLTALQSLTAETATKQQVQAMRDFANAALDDAKKELKTAQPDARGVAQQ
jgi:hypothetical protein